jgi:hypothetical protein
MALKHVARILVPHQDLRTGDYLIKKLAAATTADSPILYVSMCRCTIASSYADVD